MASPAFAMPKTAMIMAAGRGERMRPLTDETPKPMLEAGGKPLIDHILARLGAAGVERVVVNTHHHADQIENHLKARQGPPEILISPEPGGALETGGGVKKALPLLGDQAVIICNGDAVWLDGPSPALARMAELWDPERMDALLLTMLAPRVFGSVGRGDFGMDADGRLCWREPPHIAPYLYASVQIIKPQLFADGPEGPFSTVQIWDKLIEQERLFGIVHDGVWFHISTPRDLEMARPMLDERNARWLEPGEY